MRAIIALLAAVVTLAAGSARAEIRLPDIGSPADAVLPRTEEARLGRSIMREIRRQGVIVEDPEITEYIQGIGHRLAAHANDGDYEFHFFVVDDPSINAFALPGGYIGIHTGLIEATRNENELAGVVAHEIAHVTKRHIARAVHANQRASLINLATMLGAILAAAAADAGGEGVEAAVMTGQALAVQNQIDFTRANEYEADRFGVQIMAAAGFDPNGMADFFSVMSRVAGPSAARVPEFLRTHPVTSARIAETRGRARGYRGIESEDSIGYGIAKVRLAALRKSRDGLALPVDHDQLDDPLSHYSRALAMIADDRPFDARPILEALVRKHPEVIAFRIALGEAEAKDDDRAAAIETLADAAALFPRNVPLSVTYAEILIDAGEPTTAHNVLLDLFNNVPPTLDQVRLITEAAIEAGEVAEAHYYQSEYNIMLGDLVGSITMLRRALALPDVTPIQVARFEARIELVSQYLTEEQRRFLERRRQEQQDPTRGRSFATRS
ncbi:MAG: M48 family metalloprotease [Pseudomonadota bacterium]